MAVPKLIQTDDPAFIRDTKNHALLNKDRAALERHRSLRAKVYSDKQRIQRLEAEVGDLKVLVRQLLDQR